MKTWSKLALLTTLYLSQGLPFGFFHQAVPVILRMRGVSLALIGVTSLTALPWGLKFLIAPWVDRKRAGRFGRRRGVILPLQLLAVATLVIVGLTPDRGGVWLLLAAVVVSNVLAATQDIATDALAVELLSHDERGLGNGIQVAGYRGGMIIGGGVVLILMETLGWRGAFFAMAGILLAATIPIALYREPHSEPPVSIPQTEQTGGGRSFRGWTDTFLEQARRPGLLAWIAVVALYKFGEALASGMLRPFMVDAGMTLADVGRLTGVVGSVCGLIGALLGGAGVSTLGRRGALVTFGLVQAFAVALFVEAALHPSIAILGWVVGAEHLASGMATAALFTSMMDACRPGYAATDYTVQACVDVGAKGLASTVSGVTAAALGYPLHFALAGAVSLVGTLYVVLLPRSARTLAFPEVRPILEVAR